jgi:hypothetical protein
MSGRLGRSGRCSPGVEKEHDVNIVHSIQSWLGRISYSISHWLGNINFFKSIFRR